MNPVPPPNSEKTIFAQALTLPVAARSAYLDQVCGSNSDLRRGVEELLRAVNAVGFMAAPPAGLEKENMWWHQITDMLGVDGMSVNSEFPQAKLLLGRIALREGNIAAAKNYLLSADYVGKNDFGLPIELWEAGEHDVVIRFVDSVKNMQREQSTRRGIYAQRQHGSQKNGRKRTGRPIRMETVNII